MVPWVQESSRPLVDKDFKLPGITYLVLRTFSGLILLKCVKKNQLMIQTKLGQLYNLRQFYYQIT